MRLSVLLLEYNREVTAKKFGPALLASLVNDESSMSVVSDDVYTVLSRRQAYIDHATSTPDMDSDVVMVLLRGLEYLDPTKTKEYVAPLSRWYAAAGKQHTHTLLQDWTQDVKGAVGEWLERYDRLKKKNKLQPEHKDIMRFPRWEDFVAAIAGYPPEQGEYEELYRDGQWSVVAVKDKDAACHWGKNTEWCTAKSDRNQNNRYHHYGPSGHLWIFRHYDVPAYQLYIPHNTNDRKRIEFKRTSNANANLVDFYGEHRSMFDALLQKVPAVAWAFARYAATHAKRQATRDANAALTSLRAEVERKADTVRAVASDTDVWLEKVEAFAEARGLPLEFGQMTAAQCHQWLEWLNSPAAQ